jgi:hypothetical protein
LCLDRARLDGLVRASRQGVVTVAEFFHPFPVLTTFGRTANPAALVSGEGYQHGGRSDD